MKTHRIAVVIETKVTERRATSTLALVARGSLGSASSDDTEAALLDFHDDDDVIAGIVPVPPAIPRALRDALERMMALRFGGNSDRLDCWIHAGHPALRGASPFQALVAGDGVGVLRALLRAGERPRARRAGSALVKRLPTTLRLVR